MHFSKQTKAHSTYSDRAGPHGFQNTARRACWIILFPLLAIVSLTVRVTHAQMIETGDGTATTEAAIIALAKNFWEARVSGNTDALVKTLYFATNEDAQRFNRAAPVGAAFAKYYGQSPTVPHGITRIDIVTHPSGMDTGAYTVMAYFGGEQNRVAYSPNIIVVNRVPLIMYDPLQLFSAFDEDYVSVVVDPDGTKAYGELDLRMMERLRNERDIARWEAAQGDALALRAERYRQQVRDTIAKIDYAKAHGAGQNPRIADARTRLVDMLGERERMSPEALRKQAVAELQKKIDKITSVEGSQEKAVKPTSSKKEP